MMTAWGRSRRSCEKAPSSSSPPSSIRDSISMAAVLAPRWICSRNGAAKGLLASKNTVTTRAVGIISRTSWTTLPPSSAATPATPVTFPPGRRRLVISPVSIGSPAGAMMIGIPDVAALAVIAATVN